MPTRGNRVRCAGEASPHRSGAGVRLASDLGIGAWPVGHGRGVMV
jgi:hypothetical protein